MRVMTIDPGETTGYCYAEILNPRPDGNIGYSAEIFPFQEMDSVDEVWKKLEVFCPRFVVCEDFEYRRGKFGEAHVGGGGLSFFPIKVIGVVELYAKLAHHECSLYLQKAAQGKGYYTDKIVKQYGLHRAGVPHGMDAQRHFLHWLTFGRGNEFLGSKPIEETVTVVQRNDWWNLK